LERATKGTTGMDRMAGRRTDNFIRWCHQCKHEVPENVMVDRCDLCGGEIVKIGGDSK
jgi:rRNA maturation endonuclease Nob1